MKFFLILYFILLACFFALIINLARCAPKQGIRTYSPFKLECDCWGKYCAECWDKETQQLTDEDSTETEDSSEAAPPPGLEPGRQD